MRVGSGSTLGDVAVAVGDSLRRAGIRAVLSAGACAHLYSGGVYLVWATHGFILGIAVLAPNWASAEARAASRSPYAAFQSMSHADLASLQVKLTHVGEQTVATPSLMFTAVGHPPDITLFKPYRREGIVYVNDYGPPMTFSATLQELKALINGVGSVAAVADGDVDPDGYVSFGLLSTAGKTRAFEAVVNDTTGPLLIGKILSALRTNPTGARMVSEFALQEGILPTNPGVRKKGPN